MKAVYTQVRNEIVKCDIKTEGVVSYNLSCLISEEAISVIRVKSECFTSKKEAVKYFKQTRSMKTYNIDKSLKLQIIGMLIAFLLPFIGILIFNAKFTTIHWDIQVLCGLWAIVCFAAHVALIIHVINAS